MTYCITRPHAPIFGRKQTLSFSPASTRFRQKIGREDALDCRACEGINLDITTPMVCIVKVIAAKNSEPYSRDTIAISNGSSAMSHTTEYRGYEIHMDLVSTSEDMFDLWFCIEGPVQPPGVAAIGQRIKVHGGPFSRRWAHLIGELAGRAAIDVILGVEEEPPATDEW